MQIPGELENTLREILAKAGLGSLRPGCSESRGTAPTASLSSPEQATVAALITALEMQDQSIQAFREALCSSEPDVKILNALNDFLRRRQGQAGERVAKCLSAETLARASAVAEAIMAPVTDAREVVASLTALSETVSAASVAPSLCLGDLEDALCSFAKEGLEGTGKVEHPLAKLLQSLRSLPKCSEALLRQGEKALLDVLKNQLDVFKAEATDRERELASIYLGNPLQNLIDTLKKAESTASLPLTALEIRFMQFVKDLRAELQSEIDSSSDSMTGALKGVLENALARVREDFALPDREQAALPRATRVLVRSIEAQLSTLASLPDEALQEFIEEARREAGTDMHSPFNQLRELFKQVRTLASLEDLESNPIGRPLGSLQLTLEKILNSRVPSEIRSLINQAMPQLQELLEGDSATFYGAGFSYDMGIPPVELKNLKPLLLDFVYKCDRNSLGDLTRESVGASLKNACLDFCKAELPGAPAGELRRVLADLIHALNGSLGKKDVIEAARPIAEAALKTIDDLPGRAMSAGAKRPLHDVMKWQTAQDPPQPLPHGIEKSGFRELVHSLERRLQEALQHFNGDAKGTVGKNQAQAVPGNVEEVPAAVVPKTASPALFERVSRELAGYREQALLSQARQAPLPPEHFEQRALLLKDPTVYLLLKSLKDFDFSAWGNGNSHEKQFAGFLKDLVKKAALMPAGADNKPPLEREMKEGISKLEQQFASEQRKPGELHDHSARKLLSTVEQYLQGQEMLERLNPLMNLAGEPAFLLIPAILNGFVTQLELVMYPEAPPKPGDEQNQESNGNKRGYKRFEFEMRFEGMGRVQSRVWFREDELLVDLTTESDAISRFLEERFPKFEAMMHSVGYKKVEMKASNAAFSDFRPMWVSTFFAGQGKAG